MAHEKQRSTKVNKKLTKGVWKKLRRQRGVFEFVSKTFSTSLSQTEKNVKVTQLLSPMSWYVIIAGLLRSPWTITLTDPYIVSTSSSYMSSCATHYSNNNTNNTKIYYKVL